MKHLPNALTLFRIPCAVGMLFCIPLSTGYFVLYALCVASDVLDGTLARALGTTSERGSLFDSIADTVFAAALAITLIPALTWPAWVLVWVVAIAAVKLATLGIGCRRYRKLPYLHTWANKAAGTACVLLPVFFVIAGMVPSSILACAVATYASVEELVITLRSRTLQLDCKGWWT